MEVEMQVKRFTGMVQGILITAGIAVISMMTPRLTGWPNDSFVPATFLVHSMMLGLSILFMKWISGSDLAAFGLTRGNFRFSPRILLWVLPTLILGIAGTMANPGNDAPSPVSGMSQVQIVVFVWLYASICEEILTRGLLQTLISTRAPVLPGRRWRLSRSVVISGLFFGAMHLVLIPRMGPAAIGIVFMTSCLGLLAAWYRERTGSIIPAIIVHMLFNIGGTLPGWVL